MFGGDGSGPRDVAAAIDRLVETIRERRDIHFDAAAVNNLGSEVNRLRESVETILRSPLAALVNDRVKSGARGLVDAFDRLRETMQGKA